MSQLTELRVQIDGIHCAGCVGTIEKGLARLEGVSESRVNLATRSAVVRFDQTRVTQQQLFEKITELGYQPRAGKESLQEAITRELQSARHAILLAVLLTIPLMALAMLPMFGGPELAPYPYSAWLQAALAAAVMFWAGVSILRDAAIQTRHLRANMNSLIALGTLAAFGWSLAMLLGGHAHHDTLYFESAAMIITLILVGRFLEARARGRAGEAITALLSLQPTTATALINGVAIELEIGALQPGMIVQVKPGERLPADGTISSGEASIDGSMLTGEPIPQDKKTGERVFGGSLNTNKAFTMTVSASGADTLLAGIVRLVSEAQERKAPVQRLADQVAAVFVPIVIGIAAATGLAWWFLAPESGMVARSVVAVLIVACPCALGLATPTAVLAGTGRAAKAGIIIRGGDILQRLAGLKQLVFDKTGTVTTGKLQVADVTLFNTTTEHDFSAIVAAVESRSEHPIARALVQFAASRITQPMTAWNVEALPGFGVKAKVEGKNILIGSEALLSARGVDTSAAANFMQENRRLGRTAILVAADNIVIGAVAVADTVRPEARDAIGALQAGGLRVALLTGDNRRTAEVVAEAVGVSDVLADMTPTSKQQEISRRQADTGHVGMVGDGINDAPSLAAADVGIAIGSGTDVALESAGVVLVRDDLRLIPVALALARKTLRVIKQNLFWAFFYNVLAIPIAAGLLYPWTGLTLSPVIAAAAMACSSVFVVTNSLRLARAKL